jgi:hypothetical protein|tara:strand:+ start:1797 stop:2201 length:405 start_codon:yes stop_codon:yes gene_type:complete
MKNSAKNFAVLENFILFLTHSSGEKDNNFTDPQTYTPEELYRVVYDYIEEDHVDGKGAEDDYETINAEVALVAAYIVREDLLYGTFFQTYDEALKVAEEFNNEHLDTIWGLDIQWDEEVEKFVNEKYLNGKKRF